MKTMRGAKSAVLRTFMVCVQTLGTQERVTHAGDVRCTGLQVQLPVLLPLTDLGLHVQHSDFVLLVDLVDGFDFGAKHVSLKAAVLQQLIPGDALGHGFVGDKEVLLPVDLVLSLGPGGVCREARRGLSKERPDRTSAIPLKAKRGGGGVYSRGTG